jgi:hypothetical protein
VAARGAVLITRTDVLFTLMQLMKTVACCEDLPAMGPISHGDDVEVPHSRGAELGNGDTASL